jgi:hypothetical protein
MFGGSLPFSEMFESLLSNCNSLYVLDRYDKHDALDCDQEMHVYMVNYCVISVDVYD